MKALKIYMPDNKFEIIYSCKGRFDISFTDNISKIEVIDLEKIILTDYEIEFLKKIVSKL